MTMEVSASIDMCQPNGLTTSDGVPLSHTVAVFPVSSSNCCCHPQRLHLLPTAVHYLTRSARRVSAVARCGAY